MQESILKEERPLEVVTPDGEVLSDEEIRYAYTREGRRVVGKEYPNPIPLDPPIGYVPSKPLYEQIREMVQRELSATAEREGFETEDEANDFEVGDDYDPDSPYEIDFEPTAPWPGNPDVLAAEQAAIAAGGGGPQAPSGEQSAAPPPAPPPPEQPPK